MTEDDLVRSQCRIASRMFLVALLGQQKDDKALLHLDLFVILNEEARKFGYQLLIDATGASLTVRFTDV